VPTPSPTPAAPFADFPHFDDAKPGCNGLQNCWKTEETQWGLVSNNFKQKLEGQGYDVEEESDIEDDTGRRVYRVSKEGVTKYYINLLSPEYYLSLLPKEEYLKLLSTEQGTIYLPTEKLLSREELKNQVNPN
jgi:hypothetical protein